MALASRRRSDRRIRRSLSRLETPPLRCLDERVVIARIRGHRGWGRGDVDLYDVHAGGSPGRPRRTGGGPGPPRTAPGSAPARPDGACRRARVGVRLFAYYHRLESSLDAERAQEPQHFGRHRRVDAHAAERDAPTRPMVETRTATAVANALALGTAVGNVDPSSAMPAAQLTRAQPLSAANGATRQQTIPSSVVRDHTLVPRVLCPRNIALVVIHDQHTPHQHIPLLAVEVAPISWTG